MSGTIHDTRRQTDLDMARDGRKPVQPLELEWAGPGVKVGQ